MHNNVFDATISLLETYLKYLYIHVQNLVLRRLLTVALFMLAKDWKQPIKNTHHE